MVSEVLGMQGDEIPWKQLFNRTIFPLPTAVHKDLGAEGLGGSLQHGRISRFFLLTCVRYFAPEVFSHVFLVLDIWDRWIVICKKIWRVPYMIMIYQQLHYCLGDAKYQKIKVFQLNLLRS